MRLRIYCSVRIQRLLRPVCLVSALALVGCSEPDKQVTRSTEDGKFAVSLEGRKNWVRPGESLPIEVRVESLTGRLEETLTDSVEFIVNNGTVTPNPLTFSFIGTADEFAQVTGSTEDGRFALTLSAEKKWVLPGDDLPVQIRLESLPGRLPETLEESVEFSVNNGTVDSDRLFVTFIGADDSLSRGVETLYQDRIAFSASWVIKQGGRDKTIFPTSKDVGEIHARFQDLQVTLKIRIVEGDTVFERAYANWVTFTASSRATGQGEVHALFQDLQVTLKIRIVEGE